MQKRRCILDVHPVASVLNNLFMCRWEEVLNDFRMLGTDEG
jgi:hypothetical protein